MLGLISRLRCRGVNSSLNLVNKHLSVRASVLRCFDKISLKLGHQASASAPRPTGNTPERFIMVWVNFFVHIYGAIPASAGGIKTLARRMELQVINAFVDGKG